MEPLSVLTSVTVVAPVQIVDSLSGELVQDTAKRVAVSMARSVATPLSKSLVFFIYNTSGDYQNVGRRYYYLYCTIFCRKVKMFD